MADAATGLEAKIAVATAVRDIVQLSWKGQGEGQRAAVAPPVDGAWGGVGRDLSDQIYVAEN